MKLSEARILVFLTNAAKPLKCARIVAIKLRIDVVYVYRILDGMLDKNWLKVYYYKGSRFFEPRNTAPVKKAVEILNKEKETKKQRCL